MITSNAIDRGKQSGQTTLKGILLACLALVGLGLLVVLVQAFDFLVALGDRLARWPEPLVYAITALLLIAAVVAALLLFRWTKPLRRKRELAVVDRAAVSQRVAQLPDVAVAPFQAELDLLDARATDQRWYIAVFGEISAGKSSLVAALCGQPKQTGVLGGTTRQVELSRSLDGNWTYADVPGLDEVDGAARAVLAREEALRSHIVLYVLSTDISRSQFDELRWLQSFDKPMLIVLNKADLYDPAERDALRRRLTDKTGMAVVSASAGGTEQVERIAVDGTRSQISRQRQPDVAALRGALRKLCAADRGKVEKSREKAVLQAMDAKIGDVERTQRDLAAQTVVETYTRRAVVAALATVAPGTDLVIQGALAIAMIRALCAAHGASLSDVEADALLKSMGGKLRTGTTVLLAVAGNAAKAFPGLGTLGGGLLHAVAYGLLFQSVGHAVSATLLDAGRIDQRGVLARLDSSLAGQDLLPRAKQLLDLALRMKKVQQ